MHTQQRTNNHSFTICPVKHEEGGNAGFVFYVAATGCGWGACL